MGLVVGVDASRRRASRPGPAPWYPGTSFLREVVDLGVALADEVGDDVAAHVVPGVQVLGVGVQRLDFSASQVKM